MTFNVDCVIKRKDDLKMDKQKTSEITVYEGHGLAVKIAEGKMVSLTDMWKSSGTNDSKNPYNWSRFDGKEFIDAVSKKLNKSVALILKTQRGRYNGGTYAHWQIALAYAKYLSPEIHMAFNQIVKERFEEEVNPELGVNRAYDRAITKYKKQGKDENWISMRLKTILDTKKFHSTIGRRGGYGKMFGKCHNAIYSAILGGTAQEVKEKKQLAKTANIRDNLDMTELSAVNLVELLSIQRIVNKDIQSGTGCAKACSIVANNISKAMQLSLQ